MSNSKNSPDLIAYQATTRGDRSYWTRVGAAWSNRAGGINVRLNAFPLDGEIILLPPRKDEDAEDEAAAGA